MGKRIISSREEATSILASKGCMVDDKRKMITVPNNVIMGLNYLGLLDYMSLEKHGNRYTIIFEEK